MNELGLGIYKAPVVITNNSATTYTDCQFLIETNTSSFVGNGQMNADGSDIRFLDSDDSSVLNIKLFGFLLAI